MIINPTYEELEKRIQEFEQAESERKRVDEALKESEARLKALSEASYEAIFLSEKGLCLDQNQAAERMFGYTRAEAVGRYGTEWIVPEEREQVKNKMLSGYGEPYEGTALRKDGTTFPCEIQGRKIKYQGRSIRITALRDITERKRAENELLKSEERYRRIFENLQDVYYEASMDGTILEVSPSIEKISLHKRKELIGKSLFDIYAEPKKRDEFVELILDKGMVNDYEINLKDKDGSQRPCSITTLLMRDNQGNPVGLIGSMREISERKQAEEALRESEGRYRTLVGAIPDPVVVYDPDGRVTYVNDAFLQVYGWSREELMGGQIDFVPSEETEATQAAWRRTLEDGTVFFETKRWNKNGDLLDIQLRTAILRDQEGKHVFSIVIHRDITERKQSEQALRKSESTLKAILTASPIGICLVRDRTLEWTNQAMYRIWGYEMDSLLGQSTRVLYSNVDEFERVGREFYGAIEQNGIGRTETQWVTRKGEKIDCYLQGCRLDPSNHTKGIIVAAVDITERKRIEGLVRKLSHMLIEAQENERKMISYELHDSIAQNLSYLKISCDTFFDNHSGVSPELTAKMSKQSKLIAQTIDAVRELSYGLHPPSLDQLGITQTISQLCDDFSDLTGIGVDYVPTGMDALKHDPSLAINIYRLIQEGLNNIRKHANASNVKIVLVASFPNIILRIQDDGKGFDVKAREAELNETKRLGLRSMTERVNLLKGSIKIKSRIKRGTKIFIKIPFMKGTSNGDSEKAHHNHRRSPPFS